MTHHIPASPRQDYKVNPEGAQPYATVSMYRDLIESKGLGLIRADITPNLNKKVQKLWASLCKGFHFSLGLPVHAPD